MVWGSPAADLDVDSEWSGRGRSIRRGSVAACNRGPDGLKLLKEGLATLTIRQVAAEQRRARSSNPNACGTTRGEHSCLRTPTFPSPRRTPLRPAPSTPTPRTSEYLAESVSTPDAARVPTNNMMEPASGKKRPGKARNSCEACRSVKVRPFVVLCVGRRAGEANCSRL